jgi:hypothetical protein
MKTILSIIILLFCIPVYSATTNRIELKAGEHVYRDDGLYFNIPIVADWENALKEWYEPEHGTPVFRIIREFKRGQMAIPFILYRTEALKEGNANITYSIKTVKPDGDVSSQFDNLTVIQGTPPDGIGKLEQSVAFRIENDYPLGKYNMRIEITDHNANRTVCFDLEFEVVE